MSASSSCASSSSIAAHTGTTSAPSAAARARTASRCGLFVEAVFLDVGDVHHRLQRQQEQVAHQRLLLVVEIGRARRLALVEDGAQPSAAPAAVRSLPCRSPWPRARRGSAPCPPIRGRRAPARCRSSRCRRSDRPCRRRARCRRSRSSARRARSRRPRGCARGTCCRAPRPCDAPATRPAMSTNSIDGRDDLLRLDDRRPARCRRGSGTGTTPTFGSIVQNG